MYPQIAPNELTVSINSTRYFHYNILLSYINQSLKNRKPTVTILTITSMEQKSNWNIIRSFKEKGQKRLFFYYNLTLIQPNVGCTHTPQMQASLTSVGVTPQKMCTGWQSESARFCSSTLNTGLICRNPKVTFEPRRSILSAANCCISKIRCIPPIAQVPF